MSVFGETASAILARQGGLGETASYKLFAKKKKKKEEEEKEPSLPQELIESYEQRLRAIGIEPPEKITHRGETKRPWWQRAIFTPLQKILAVLDWPGNIVRSVLAELIVPEKFEGNILSALGESIIRRRHVSGHDILQAIEEKNIENLRRSLEGKVPEQEIAKILKGFQPNTIDKIGKFLGSIAIDIALDPLTYTGIGALTKQGKAAKIAERLTKSLGVLAEKSDDVAKILQKIENTTDIIRYGDELKNVIRSVAKEAGQKSVVREAARAEKLLERVIKTKPTSFLAPTAAEQARLGQRAILKIAGIPVIKGAPVFELGREIRLAAANLPGIRQLRELIIPGAKMRASSRFTPELAEEALHRWRVAEPAAIARTEEKVKSLASLMKELGIDEPAKRREALKLIESPAKITVRESLEEVTELIPRTLEKPMRATRLETASATSLFRLRPYRDLSSQYSDAVRKLSELEKRLPSQLPDVGRRAIGIEALPEEVRKTARNRISQRDEAIEEAIRRTESHINREAFQRLKIYHEIDDYRRGLRTELSDDAIRAIEEAGGDLRKAAADARRSLIARGQAIVREEYDVVKKQVPVKKLERVEREVPSEIEKIKNFWESEARKLLEEERIAGIQTPQLQVIDTEAERALKILDAKPIVSEDDAKTLAKILELETPSTYVYHVLTPEARKWLTKKHMTVSDVLSEPGFASYAKTRRLRSTVEAINEYTTQKYGMKFFRDDFLDVAVRRYHQHYRDLERLDALKDLSQVKLLDGNPVAIRVGKEVPKGYVRLGGPLGDWAIVQELHDDVVNITRAFREVDDNALARAVDKVMNLWRPFATIYNPGFHMRNAYSNIWQLALKDGANAVSPTRIRQSFRLLLGKDLDKTFRTATGEIITGREIVEQAKKLGIIERMAAFRGVEQGMSIDAVLDMLAGKVPGHVVQRAARSFGRMVENHARLLGFMDDILAGYTPMEAALRTKKYLFDYSELTGFEARILKRIFPFYTWTRKNLPLQLKSLAQKPRQFAAFGHLERELREASGKIDEEYTPEYFSRLFAIPTPLRIGGKQYWWNPDLPIQDIQMLGDPRDVLGMLSPVIKVPIELITNRSLFWGTPIKRSEWQKIEAPSFLHPLINVPVIRDILGLDRILSPYRREGEERWTIGMDPTMSYLFQQWPFLANIAKWTAYTRPGERIAADIMSGVGGIKFFAYDPEVEKLRVAYENLNRLQEFMRYLEHQKGIDVPTQKDVVDFLRTVYGIPVPSRQTLGRFQPEVDYWSYLERYLPLPAEDVTRFKRSVQTGEVLVPSESEIEQILAYLTGAPRSQEKIERQTGRPYIEYLAELFGEKSIPPDALQEYLRLLREGLLRPSSRRPLSTIMQAIYGKGLTDLRRELFGIPRESRVTRFDRMAPSIALEKRTRRRRR